MSVWVDSGVLVCARFGLCSVDSSRIFTCEHINHANSGIGRCALRGVRRRQSGASQSAQDLREHHTDTTVSFTLKMSESTLAEMDKRGLHKTLKLSSSLATSNMTLFDDQARSPLPSPTSNLALFDA